MMQPISENTINVPAFLSKLWKMVEDPNTENLICWSSSGNNFIIQNQAGFWYDLLPLYYKHNNMSSFVRQLNMYGFHKMSAIENIKAENEKDELHFYHKYFQKGKPELLKYIKRKVTNTSKPATSIALENQTVVKTEDLSKFLSDVKQLKGRQASIDNQLAALKQENTVLWRELALFRQKHIKQQQIVNKLIQFLVTIVQPNSRMPKVNVKRSYPLMINENPIKRQKEDKPKSTSEGLVIHELDNASEATDIPDELLSQSEIPDNVLDNESQDSSILMDEKHNLGNDDEDPIMMELLSDGELHHDPVIANVNVPSIETFQKNIKTENISNEDDTLLNSLMSGTYNSDKINEHVRIAPKIDSQNVAVENLTVATRNSNPPKLSRLNSIEELGFHVENTQNEIDQFKELLNGCQTVDLNALLTLFSEDSAPSFGLSNFANEDQANFSDPMLSSSELVQVDPDFDFSQLFDDSSDEKLPMKIARTNIESNSVDTPEFNPNPIFSDAKPNSKSTSSKKLI